MPLSNTPSINQQEIATLRRELKWRPDSRICFRIKVINEVLEATLMKDAENPMKSARKTWEVVILDDQFPNLP